MKILFVKSHESQLRFELERQMIKTGLLVSELFYAITPNLLGIVVHKNRDKANDKSIINNYKYYFCQFGIGIPEPDLDTYIQQFTKLRNKKFKNRDDLLQIGRWEQVMHKIRLDVILAAENWMRENKLESLLGFSVDNSLIVFDEESEIANDELFYQNVLIDEFTNPHSLHFLGVNKILDNVEHSTPNHEFKSNPNLIYTSTLFHIPCLDTLSYAQMKIIRNEFEELLQPFYNAVAAMKTEFDAVVITADNVDQIDKRFDELMEEQIIFLKETVSNNIYFQQIVNSSTDYKMYEFNISFATMKTMINLYQYAGVISEMEVGIILEKIALTKDINTCCLFLDMAEISMV